MAISLGILTQHFRLPTHLTATRPSKSPPCWQKGRLDEFLAFEKKDETPEMWQKVSRCLQIPQLLSQMDKKNFHMEKHFWIPFNYIYFFFFLFRLSSGLCLLMSGGCGDGMPCMWSPELGTATYDTCSPLFTYMRTPNHTLNTLHFLQ